MLNRSRSPRRLSGCGDIERFIEENEIDDTAGNALREATDEVKQSVLEEGAVTGRNKSAILISRIRRAESGGGGGSRAPSRSQGGFNDHTMTSMRSSSGDDLAAEVMAFCDSNGVDASTLEDLLAQPPDLQIAVMNEGSITGRNPSAVLLSRLRRLEQRGPPPRGVTLPRMPRSNFAWGPPAFAPVRRSRSPSPISLFAAESGIDETALQELREQPPALQRLVLAEGPLTGSRNPSAVLKSRLRRLQEKGAGRGHQAPKAHEAPWTNASVGADRNEPWNAYRRGGVNFNDHFDSRGGSNGRGQNSLQDGGGMSPRQFVNQYDLDEDAKGEFFALPLDMQQTIVEEGFLTGRNQSAVLLSRIRRVTSSGVAPTRPPPGPSVRRFSHHEHSSAPPNVTQRLNVTLPWANSHRQQSRSQDPVSQFVHVNRLDEGAARELRAQSPQVQDAVMKEGAITGRNISAVLTSRIKRAVGGTMSESQGRPWANKQPSSEKPVGHDLFEPEEDVDPVAKFCSTNGIDGSASQALREAPMEVQLQILEEGHITGRNPNAVLLSRLRRKGH